MAVTHAPVSETPTMRDVRRTLRTQFDLKSLRPGQEEVIRSILDGNDTLAIMPTGGGKSLCYQLPSLFVSGTTLVISPLLSLVKDQREKLDHLGIESVEFNSSVPRSEIDHNLEAVEHSETDVIYATPERLANPKFLEKMKQSGVALFVIDEAHCISQWGHDFRPAFLEIGSAIKALGHPPVLALTATATPEVAADIQKQLGLKEMKIFRTNLHRENLRFRAVLTDKEDEKKTKLVELLGEMNETYPDSVGIIYVSTVKKAQELYDLLVSKELPAFLYHGKMKPKDRAESQSAFMSDQGGRKIMVATNAFGMGIDKANIRYAIHYTFPGSLEAYYQEAGRAGRDGKPSDCTLLYLKKDKSVQSLFLSRKYPSDDEVRDVFLTLARASENGPVEKEAFLKDEKILHPRKATLVLTFLKQFGVLEEKKGILRVLPKMKKVDVASTLTEKYKERREKDQQKLQRVIQYAQTALCRWNAIQVYFEDETDGNCGHCDNCLRDVVRAKEHKEAEMRERNKVIPALVSA